MNARRVEKLYEKHRDTLVVMCRAFKDWRSMEDKLSDANLAFMEACRTYDPEKSAFKTWLDRCVTNRLKEERERRFEYIQRYKQFEETYEGPFDHRNAEPFVLEGLSESAQVAVELALKLIFARPKAVRGGTFKATSLTYGKAKTIVLSKLRRLGWSEPKITKVFARIRKAMRDR